MRLTARPILALTFAALSLVASPAAQAKYPDKPVRIVLPFAAGGVADITARIVAEKLGDKLGQRFVVENQAGAGGITAARTVISSPPDDYTLALLSNGTAVSVSLFKKLPFDPLKDFAAISSLGYFDFIFATSTEAPYKTLADFVAAAKEKPGTPKIQVGLLQGNVVLMIDSYSSMKGNLASGKLRALASSGAKRSEATPDLATVTESGVAGYDVVSWNASFAPAGTPLEIITTLNDALKEILADADVKKRMLDLGIEARASTPEEISDRLKADIEKWGKVIEKAGIPKQ
jgi:tripartite-type tricarboxylate transporter receptor subunit TctC